MNVTIQSEDLRELLKHVHCGGPFPTILALTRLYGALALADEGGKIYMIGLNKPDRKIEAIKGVRRISGCGLKGAKDLVEACQGGTAIDLGNLEEEAIRELRDAGVILTWEPPEYPRKPATDFFLL